MFQIIPIYIVIIKPQPNADQGIEFRVPKDRLENFVSVLIFNGINAMTINIEEPTNAITD